MKRLILAVAAVICCTFTYGIATNSDAKLNDIEMIEKKINALKAERANSENKRLPIIEEVGIYIKKAAEFENKTKIPDSFSEKVENDIKV
jgi:hypothetical protein